MDITEEKLKEMLTEQREAFQGHVKTQMDGRFADSERRTEAKMDKWFAAFQQHVDVKIDGQGKEFQRVVEKEHETRHEFGLLKEHFDSKVEVGGEQLGSLSEDNTCRSSNPIPRP